MIGETKTWLNRVMALPRINCRSFSSNRFMSKHKRKMEKRKEAKK